MAYILTTEELKTSIGEGRSGQLPFVVVLSRREDGGYRLEMLEGWLSRHRKREREAVIHTLSPDGDIPYPSDTC